MRKLVRLAFAVAGLAGGLALADEARPGPPNAQPDAKTVMVFKRSCASCHGADGKGQTVMGKKNGVKDWTDPAWQAAHDGAKVKELLTADKPEVKGADGKPFAHPKPSLSAAQVDALVAYVKSFGTR